MAWFGVQAQGLLAEEQAECLHSHSLRSTLYASQRYLTADVRQQIMIPSPRKRLLIVGCLLLCFIIAAYFLCVGLAPFTKQSPAPFALWPETVDTSDYFGIDYGALASAAYAGSPAAIQRMMRATKTLSGSGAGSYGHGAAMLEVLWKNGDETFIQNLKTLPFEEQKRVIFILLCGDEYTFNKSYKEKLASTFPALSEYRESIE